MNLLGCKIIENEMAMTLEPRKVHKKRRNQSAAYHKRIQKKWKKRYGTEARPGIWFISGAFTGVFGQRGPDIMAVHPSLMDKIGMIKL